MVKYLKKIGVLSLLFSVAINNNVRAMDGNKERINYFKQYNSIASSSPIIRDEEHLRDCAKIGDFKDKEGKEDIKSLKNWLSLFLPDEAVGKFVWSQKQAGITGDNVCISIIENSRKFAPISKVLDWMASLFASDKAKKFFESKDKEIIIKSSDFPFLGSFPPVKVKMSKMPAFIGKPLMKYWSVGGGKEPILVYKSTVEETSFAKLTINQVKNSDFVFIVAQIEKQPIIFIRYRNICLSNLVRNNEVNKYEYNGKKFDIFTVEKMLYVFNRKEPLSFENIIIEI